MSPRAQLVTFVLSRSTGRQPCRPAVWFRGLWQPDRVVESTAYQAAPAVCITVHVVEPAFREGEHHVCSRTTGTDYRLPRSIAAVCDLQRAAALPKLSAKLRVKRSRTAVPLVSLITLPAQHFFGADWVLPWWVGLYRPSRGQVTGWVTDGLYGAEPWPLSACRPPVRPPTEIDALRLAVFRRWWIG